MAQDVADFDAVLAIRGELRPVRRYRRERIETAAVDEQQGGQRSDVLGAGEDIDDRVPGPFPGFGTVGIASPDIHHELALDIDRDGRPELATGGDFFGERGGDIGESRVTVSVDHGIGAGGHWFSSLGHLTM